MLDASGNGTTGSSGTVTFSGENARPGDYTTEVTGVTVAGLNWDGITPTNAFIYTSFGQFALRMGTRLGVLGWS